MPIRGGGHAPRNDFQTRDVELVIAAIAHLLPPAVHIWEPFAGTAARRLSTGLEEAGFAVSCTGLPQQDFFAIEPPPGVTMVVTNPPFDLRTPIMERLNALGLPYCMLMPMNTLETDARQAALSEGHPLCLRGGRGSSPRTVPSFGGLPWAAPGSARSLTRWVVSCSPRISRPSIEGRMGILSSKPASEIDVLRAVELKAIALGSKLDTGHDLLILAAAAIKAENQRATTPGSIRRIEVSCLLWKMLQLYGSDVLLQLYPSPASLEGTVEIVFQLNRLDSDVFVLMRALERADARAAKNGVAPDA
jgi:hypothetical protein